MQIEVLDTHSSEYDDFVQSSKDGKLCHLQEWSSMVSRTFGHATFNLVALERGVVCGVLPLTLIRSRIFGNRLVSQAFSNYGGPLADKPDALAELLNRAFELALEHGCSTVEFRSLQSLPYDLVLQKDKVCMFLPLVSDPDEMWRHLKPEIRNRIRKAEKSGLIATSGGQELLGEFYQLWTIRMHQLGTPCYSKNLFRNILETFPQYSRIFVVEKGNQAVGTAFSYSFNGLCQCRWSATRTEFNGLAPNTLLYWSAIRHHCLAGDRTFDFGRSTPNSSQYEFKRRWRTKTIQLHYQYWTHPGHKLSLATPDNPKYRNKIQMWKKLPLWMTRLIGPHISRSLP